VGGARGIYSGRPTCRQRIRKRIREGRQRALWKRKRNAPSAGLCTRLGVKQQQKRRKCSGQEREMESERSEGAKAAISSQPSSVVEQRTERRSSQKKRGSWKRLPWNVETRQRVSNNRTRQLKGSSLHLGGGGYSKKRASPKKKHQNPTKKSSQ